MRARVGESYGVKGRSLHPSPSRDRGLPACGAAGVIAVVASPADEGRAPTGDTASALAREFLLRCSRWGQTFTETLAPIGYRGAAEVRTQPPGWHMDGGVHTVVNGRVSEIAREVQVVIALERLLAVASELGADELAVLNIVAERLRLGRERYGELRVAADQRDFAAEGLEEAADGLVYAAVALMRSGR